MYAMFHKFPVILQTEILSTETSDFLKQIIFLKPFNSVCVLFLNLIKGEWIHFQGKQLRHHFHLCRVNSDKFFPLRVYPMLEGINPSLT